MFVAYLRVSSADQNLDRQQELIAEWQKDKNVAEGDLIYFNEKVSGKDVKNRVELLRALDYLRERDTFLVTSLDRLGRNSKDIKDLLQQIKNKGANIEILDLPSFAGVTDPTLRELLSNLVIEVFSYVAETERTKIKERQEQGIVLAKERGIYKGRPLKYHADAIGADKLVYDKAIDMLSRGFTVATIARELKLPRKTVYSIRDRNNRENI
ncbi:recombinase family protein [Enterococcus sp. AZ103]|uniref:recombinase family protein n=1 Tax=Enterococcus sp. AZ103 TaxID=2774628 RepID=UPI003F2868F8